MNFSLPLEVTLKKEMFEGCLPYSLRHKVLGDLGRILLHNLPESKTHIGCEVSGDPSDPMAERRLEILQPHQLSNH